MMNYIQYMKPGGTSQHADATYVHVPTAGAVQHPLLTDPRYLAWAEKQKDPTVEKYLKFLEETNSYGGDLNDADLPASSHKHSPQYLEQFAKEQAELQAKTNAVMSTVGMLGGFGVAGVLAPMGTAALGASLGTGDYFDVMNLGSSDWNPGWKRTTKAYSDLKSGEVLDPTVFAGNVARDALDIVSMTSPAVVKYVLNKAVLDANARAYAEQHAAKTADNHIRIKVGDVEVNDPNLAYRQIGESIAREFPVTGRQVPSLAESEYGMERALKPIGIVLGKAPFPNPMYAQGHLWYGLPQEGSTMTGLLTTNQPLLYANKSARLVLRKPIITSEDGLVTTAYDPRKGGIVGTRRIPLQGQLNSSNTSAYIYDPKYGYRIINTLQPKTSLAFFERYPAKISEAERLGIPKGERNSVLIDRGQLSKRFRWIDGELVPEYKQRTLGDDIPWWDAKNWDIHDGKVYTDADGVKIYKFRPPKVQPLDFTESPIVNWGNELPEASFTRWDKMLNRPVTRAEFLRPPWQAASEADIKMSKILKSVAENSNVSEKLISAFDNAMIEARFRLFYYNKGYYLSEDLTRRDIAKIVADNYAQLTATLQGKLKNLILWNGSSEVKQFDNVTGQFTTIREAAPENFTIIKTGYRTSPSDRAGIYFNTQPVGYDLTRVVTRKGFAGRDLIENFPDLIEYSVTKGDKLPYLINKVRNVIREYWPENLKQLPEGTVFNTTQNKGNLSIYPQDPLKAHEFFVQSPENIKSLFPHPNLFVENADGTWSMLRSWDNPGLHFKSGGTIHIKKSNVKSVNYLNFFK